jgi:hypothetical protein
VACGAKTYAYQYLMKNLPLKASPLEGAHKGRFFENQVI